MKVVKVAATCCCVSESGKNQHTAGVHRSFLPATVRSWFSSCHPSMWTAAMLTTSARTDAPPRSLQPFLSHVPFNYTHSAKKKRKEIYTVVYRIKIDRLLNCYIKNEVK